MLKKTAHIVLSLLLLVSTTGITITRHYCGNTLERIAINSEPKSCCTKDGCCHNESALYQVKDEFFAPESNQTFNVPVIDALFMEELCVNWHEPLIFGFTSFSIAESPPPLMTTTVISLLQAYLC